MQRFYERIGMKNPFDKVLSWYFTKNSLPYWSILLIDCLIIIGSGMVTYWIFNNANLLFENTPRVLNTLVCFVILSIPGFRLFHTYSGFMRFASFSDLMRVVYGNLVSLGLVLVMDFLLNHYYTKSEAEFFEKLRRGWPDQPHKEFDDKYIRSELEKRSRCNEVYDPIMLRYSDRIRELMRTKS